MKNEKEKILMSWSGGKDSSLALFELLESECYEIVGLLTAVAEEYGRISMHGVREDLLDAQARSIGLPIVKVFIPSSDSSEEFESRMQEVLERYAAKGVSSVAFGDIFLEDLRTYREDNLRKVGMKGIFPLWKKDTEKLARTFLSRGFRTIITCVDSRSLDGSFSGREYNEQFLSDLPDNVDPCGENGEFHSFAYEGPLFQNPVLFERGEVVVRNEHFYFCDLLPVIEQPVGS